VNKKKEDKRIFEVFTFQANKKKDGEFTTCIEDFVRFLKQLEPELQLFDGFLIGSTGWP